MNSPQSIVFPAFFPVCRSAFSCPAIRGCENVQGLFAMPVNGAMRLKLKNINAKMDISTVNDQ
jgi:hypothetical protein